MPAAGVQRHRVDGMKPPADTTPYDEYWASEEWPGQVHQNRIGYRKDAEARRQKQQDFQQGVQRYGTVDRQPGFKTWKNGWSESYLYPKVSAPSEVRSAAKVAPTPPKERYRGRM